MRRQSARPKRGANVTPLCDGEGRATNIPRVTAENTPGPPPRNNDAVKAGTLGVMGAMAVGDAASYLASSAQFVKSVMKTLKGPELKSQR